MTVDIVAQRAEVLAGAFAARAIYGGEYIDPAFNVPGDGEAEKADDYRGYLQSQPGWTLLDASDLPTFDDMGGDASFTANGLYDAKVHAGLTDTFDAQGLLAVEGGDTLVLTFRGTDGEDPAVVDGQAFTGYAVAANYKAFKPLIDAAYDYVASHQEISKVVVSGHSLGGAMADVFTIADAARFRDLVPGGLTIVSLASSGVPKDLPAFLGGIDDGTVTYETLLGLELPIIDNLIRPDDYISIADAGDRAHFPDDFPSIPEAPGLVPIVTLKPNLHFGGDTVLEVPNIDNTDVEYYDPDTHPFDYRGMGAQHSSALLWANLEGFLNDALRNHYASHHLVFGNTDYNTVPDLGGKPIALFEGYTRLNDPSDDDDRGDKSLHGGDGNDYILGLSGNDRIVGGAGDDIVSGGLGNDILRGGLGDDQIHGGKGADKLAGDLGEDRFYFVAIADSRIGRTADTVLDFSHEDGDLVHLARLDAMRAVAGNQAFEFIGDAGFTGEGQLRAIQSGDDTLLRLNLSGTSRAEMQIVMHHVDASSLTATDFIL